MSGYHSYLSNADVRSNEVEGKTCWVVNPYGYTGTGVIRKLNRDGYSENVEVYVGDEIYYAPPQMVFLSKPILVTFRDIFGEMQAWQESSFEYR